MPSLESLRDELAALAQQPNPWPTNDPVLAEIVRLASRIVARDRKQQRRETRQRDADLADRTRLRSPHTPAPIAAPAAVFANAHQCYVCKTPFTTLHHFYDCLCPTCGDDHERRRSYSIDLSGRVALVLGGRIKSGYHTVLKLLRAGAEVIATTRFPIDAARRFANEPDADTWTDRLRLVALDLRFVPAIEQFTNHLRQTRSHLDIVIANAAQTVRRPPAFYATLADAERAPLATLPANVRTMLADQPHAITHSSTRSPAEWAMIPLLPNDSEAERFFPLGQVDSDGQALDLRTDNSWGLSHEQVSTVELFEVQMVNSLAPFVVLRELRDLFRRSPASARFAVMVSATEGQFASEKRPRHPHTNMAKAALNMFVRTAASEFLADRVYLTAVDPGWFSVQSAAPIAERFVAHGGRVPLDALDAAARILAPIFDGLASGEPASGVLFKDYRVVDW